MPSHMPPLTHQWYRDVLGQLMQVTVFDKDAGLVEVQLFEGEVDEYDLDHWHQLELEAIDPPEDWSGPFDDLEADDLESGVFGMHRFDLNRSLDDFDLDRDD